MASQLALDLTARTWGGKRDGSGRKPSTAPRHDPPHRARPVHVARNPVHVVLRCRKEVGRLRRRAVHQAAHRALIVIAARIDFRVAHISIQGNHIHLLVEAGDTAALESGMRALAISLAKRINRSLDRTGKVFAFRYHATSITSPRQTRNALSYVLNNWRRHNEDERGGLHEREMAVDPYSSALAFHGWSDFRLGLTPPPEFVELPPLPVSRAQTWLLAVGWEKSKHPVRAWDTPGPIVARR